MKVKYLGRIWQSKTTKPRILLGMGHCPTTKKGNSYAMLTPFETENLIADLNIALQTFVKGSG